MAVKHQERAHARLSASGSSRWINCPPSVKIEENFVEEPASEYAAEGTLAHEFADLGLKKAIGVITARKYNAEAKKLKQNELYDPEMDQEVQKYIDFVLEDLAEARRETPDAELLIEEKVDLSAYVPESFGTCDANIIADGTLQIIDLKYGKGVKVDAAYNSQLMLYALGALEAYSIFYDIINVKLCIIQPRLDHYSAWEISVTKLEEWGNRVVKPAAKLAFAGEGVQQAGSWCRWCKAAAKCSTLASANLKLIDDEFRDPYLLKDDQLLDIYDKMDQIETWIKTVRGFMLKEALAGVNWPGYKLVAGRSNRKWRNEDEVIEVLHDNNFGDDEIMNVKLQGITAIEKLVTKKRFPELLGDLVIKPAGAPTLVRESDKRPAINNINEFDDE